MTIIQIKHHDFGEERTIDTEAVYSYLGEMGISDERIQRQVKLEHTAYEQGEARFLKNLLRDIESDRVAMNEAFSRPFNWMLDVVGHELERRYEEQAGKTGNQKSETWYRYVKDIHPFALANLICSKFLSMAVGNVHLSWQTVVDEVGKAIEKECRASLLVQTEAVEWDKRYAKSLKERRSDKNRYEFMKRVETAQVKEGNIIPWTSWSGPEHQLVGHEMLQCMQRVTNLFVEEQVPPQYLSGRWVSKKSNHTHSAFAMNPEWIERINDEVFQASIRSVKYPMLVPPKPWRNVLEGGYWTNGNDDSALISTFRRNIFNNQKVRQAPMVLDAVNIIQSTGWKINTFIYDVIKTLLDNDELGKGFDDPASGKVVWPPKEPPRTVRLPDTATATEIKTYKKEMAILFREDEKRKAKRREVETGLAHAKMFLSEPEFYLPGYLDFRGRCYATPTLNQQKGDFVKGLLMFSDAKPVGERGWFWMRIATATLGGYDKCDKETLDYRDKWFWDNVGRIIAVGYAPWSDSDFWMSADKPMLFLAMCHEVAMAMERIPEEYRCGIPINFDGSCSGLQHYSAMALDEVGGMQVNLIPTDKYNDVYTVVRELTFKQVDTDIKTVPAEGDFKAVEWRQRAMDSVNFMKARFDRKHMAKPPVMTFCYSANHGTFMEQFRDRVMTWYKENEPTVNWGLQNYYLAKTVENTTRSVVVKAGECMDWLMTVTEAMKDNGEQAMAWVTPDGWYVYQEYLDKVSVTRSFNTTKLVVSEGGREVKVRSQQKKAFQVLCDGLPLPSVNTNAKQEVVERKLSHKQVSSIAPNLIHSMDATHLRMTVRACKEKGVNSFSMIHDSFGVMPADAQCMFDTVREQFVKLYDEDAPDMLKQIDEYVKERLPKEVYDKLPPRPSKGNLDLQGVLKSTYAFL